MERKFSRRTSRRETEDGMIKRFGITFQPSMDERAVSVYLPKREAADGERYPVMYMLDGQNAFEPGRSRYGRSWGLHTFLDAWEKPMIAVALDSSPESDRRLAEYCPYPLEPRSWEGLRARGQATARWIAEVLKPRIDEAFPTIPNRACTGIMGASMGGVMGLYAVTALNDVFSKAACLSPALPLCYPQLLREVRKREIDPDTRVYLSWGECEARSAKGLTHMTAEHLTLAGEMTARGARVYPFLLEEGRHCEEDWAGQMERFMRFLWLE